MSENPHLMKVEVVHHFVTNGCKPRAIFNHIKAYEEVKSVERKMGSGRLPVVSSKQGVKKIRMGFR